MLSIEVLILFSVTTFFVVLAPGPAALAVAVEAASNGFQRSLLVTFGIAFANAVLFILSAVGIGAAIVASESLFLIIKWVGIIYLLYLGFGALFSATRAMTIQPKNKSTGNLSRLFFRGFTIEVTNPKALLYFTALLPQFINSDFPIVPQIIIFIVITIVFDFVCYSLYGYLGWKTVKVGMSERFVKIINKSAGVTLIIVAILVASVTAA
ncbi:MAG: LysE family translocator [Gammaproteobacteria bacterium]